jgi:white-opaque regulator 2
MPFLATPSQQNQLPFDGRGDSIQTHAVAPTIRVPGPMEDIPPPPTITPQWLYPPSHLAAPSDNEKAMMLRGESFTWIDPTLVLDRLRCKMALVCFNDNTGMADDDLISWKLLKRVLVPDSSNSLHMDKPIGSLGPGAVVETPFQCEYGYNIKIGENVHIGRKCTIIDAGTVIIGQETTIGPMVTIIAGAPVNRKGINSRWEGRPVIIEDNVIVGAGVFIYRGVRLGARCTIEPGSVVKYNVLPDQRIGPPAAVRYR